MQYKNFEDYFYMIQQRWNLKTINPIISTLNFSQYLYLNRGCRGRDHMVVGFTTSYAIGAYHH